MDPNNLPSQNLPNTQNPVQPINPPPPNTDITNNIINPTPLPEKPKSKLPLIILIIILLITLTGGTIFYYLNLKLPITPEVSQNQLVPTSQPSITPQITELPGTNKPLTELLSDLSASTNLEIAESSTLTIVKCIGTGTLKGIIQNNNYYALSQSNFTLDSVVFCPEDLKATYYETYWIGEKIYYKQYPNKPFAIKNPDEPIAVGENPKDYIARILPDPNTIQILPSTEAAEIKFKGVTKDAIEITYTATVANNKIKQLIYQTEEIDNPDIGPYSAKGTIQFGIPDLTLTAPEI